MTKPDFCALGRHDECGGWANETSCWCACHPRLSASVVPPSERQAVAGELEKIAERMDVRGPGNAMEVLHTEIIRLRRAAAQLRSPQRENPLQVSPADPNVAAVLKEFGWYDAEQNARDVAGKLAQEIIRLRSPLPAFDRKAFVEKLAKYEALPDCYHTDCRKAKDAAYRDLLSLVRGKGEE